MQMPNGEQVRRDKDTPQGGVISPILANQYLHYVYGKWMEKYFPNRHWCRYEDDGLVHCCSEAEAKHMLAVLEQRFNACGLELHPLKKKSFTVKMAVAKYAMKIWTLIFLAIRSGVGYVKIANEIVCL